MSIRSFFGKLFAGYIDQQTRKWASQPQASQEKVFRRLIGRASQTQFGKDHHFASIETYDDFKRRVPIRDYEQLQPYIEKMISGEKDVLWPGKPLYLSKTSGTTSGVKYIPITKESIPNHFVSARNAVLAYVAESGCADFLGGKLIFLSGSPLLQKKAGIHVGRLSGIVNHHVPGYLRTNQLPSYDTNCIDDWEMKLDKIVDETLEQNMTLISGIPPWVQMYFDKVRERTGGKKISEVFPNFNLFVYGGVNFEPYKAKLFDTIGKTVPSVETYPASEGFIAYQNQQNDPGLLILLDSGIFFEFIPADEFFDDHPTRLMIHETELHKNYALIINSNAGLWGYAIGDTVKFISKNPYKLLVTGRIKHFISAFGEHVIGEEVEQAMKKTCRIFPETELIEFTVAPNVTPKGGLPLHEWYVEFAKKPSDLSAFEKALDLHLCQLNTYYDDLITGRVLRPLKIITLKAGSFIDYMRSQGRLGGQNKVPRLANDRKIADWFLENECADL